MIHLNRPFYYQEDWEDTGEQSRDWVRVVRTTRKSGAQDPRPNTDRTDGLD